MSDLVRRDIPLAIAVIAIGVMIGDYVFAPLKAITLAIQNGTIIVSAFAMGLAMVSMTIYHIRVVYRRGPGWYYSICTLVACYTFMIAGLTPPLLGGPQYHWMYKWINTVSGRTTYAALAFWISAAALRTLRLRSLEASLMVVTAMICMFANAPLSALMGPFKPIASWLLRVPSTAAYRAIAITTACGVFALGLRVILGRERPWE